MTASHPIPLIAILLLSGCVAGVAGTSSSSATPDREDECSFSSATTCWTLAPRIPAPRDSAPDQLLTPRRPVLAARADSAVSP
jgi:hypothetical protein